MLKIFFPILVSFILSAHPAGAENLNFEDAAMNYYKALPEISPILQNDSRLIPEIRKTLENPNDVDASKTNEKVFVLEIGFQTADGKILYGYFPKLVKLLRAQISADQVAITDVSAVKPNISSNIWAHYKLFAGSLSPDKSSTQISKILSFKNLYYHYSQDSGDQADVYAPLTQDGYLQIRNAYITETAYPTFMATTKGSITFGPIFTEECDGNLSSGVKGGGKTGWCPWTAEFVGLVKGVNKGDMSALQPVDILNP
jgi:hypothetical protein